LGNSIQYFNDQPRLLQHLLQTSFGNVFQDSCLRGGSSLPSLYEEGNGMWFKFETPNALQPDGTYDVGQPTIHALLAGANYSSSNHTHHHFNHTHNHTNHTPVNYSWAFRHDYDPFDFVIMNDYTQGPARKQTREMSLEALREHYGPLLKYQQKQHEDLGHHHRKVTPVFLQTWAYRKAAKGSDDLGSVAEFTARISHGYKTYVQFLKDEFGIESATIAPVGNVFLWVHQNKPELWDRLIYIDDLHPTPHGSWLESCVLYTTLMKERFRGREGDGSILMPPVFNVSWFKTARYMMPPEDEQKPLPTDEEAEEIRQIVIELLLRNETILETLLDGINVTALEEKSQREGNARNGLQQRSKEKMEKIFHNQHFIFATCIFLFLILLFGIVGTYQMLNNPGGYCASICRLLGGCACFVARVIFFPCRKIFGCEKDAKYVVGGRDETFNPAAAEMA